MNIDFLTSYEALRMVYSDGAFSNLAVNDAIKAHDDCSPGFVRMMVKGVLRNTMLIDYFIDRLARNGIRGIKSRTLVIIRIGICALMEMDSIPDRVAVNETVALAKMKGRGSEGFVNAILRSFQRDRNSIALPPKGSEDFLSTRYSCAEGIVRLLISQYGYDEGARIIRSFNDAPELMLRCNLCVQGRDELITMLRSSGYTAEPDRNTASGIRVIEGSPVSDRMFAEGRYSVQSSSSLRAVECLGPDKGSEVLDMCAAPGGKSAAMAEMMGDTGRITACDVYDHRLDLIEKNALRLGLSSVTTKKSDGTVTDSDMIGRFDHVLADVPCSGLGVVGSKPEIKLRTDTERFKDLYEVQKIILENAFMYTKPGGTFMYSTCTINRCENEDIIDDFLANGRSRDVETVEKDLILPYNNNTGFFFCKMRRLF